MTHRHLNHSNWTLAAIDSCITRGTPIDYAELRAAALSDLQIMNDIKHICGSVLGRYNDENFDRELYEDWLRWADEMALHPKKLRAAIDGTVAETHRAMLITKNGTYKRVLAIGDIHGYSYHLQDLLAAVKPTKDDLIVTLGDYIDRGYYSKEVFDILITMHRDFNVVSLRGNHDALMLMCFDAIMPKAYYPRFKKCDEHTLDAWEIVTLKEPAQLWFGNQGLATLSSYCDPGSEQMQRLRQVDGMIRWPKDYQEPLRDLMADLIPQAHIDFLRNTCVDTCETGNFIFVHGGLCPDLPLADQPLFPLHWMRFDENWKPHVSGKKVICGHTPHRDLQVRDIGRAACLDTGAFMAKGFLTCVDVQTGHCWQVDTSYGIARDKK